MNIPFLDLKREMSELMAEGLLGDIEKTLLSGNFLFGDNSDRLEKFMSDYFGSHAILVGSGTDALTISLMAIGIKYGDMVAIPSFTAIPTAAAVKMLGAIPIYIDIEENMTMSTYELAKVLEKYDIKAVVPVHLFGNPANMSKIISMCKYKEIPIIEDCAQSFGTTLEGQLTGTFGITGAFSFYPTKNLGAASDSGMIITKNEDLANLIRELRFYGQKSKYNMGSHIGINSRTDEIQCSILLKKIAFLERNTAIRKALKEKYNLSFLNKLTNAWIPEWHNEAVPHLYPILSKNRDKIIENLRGRGIETAIHYPFCLPEAIEKLPVLKENCLSKIASQQIFSIPFNPWLTKEEIDYIIESVIESTK